MRELSASCRRGALAAALAASSFAIAPLHAALPPIGSANVAIADPDIPAPPSDPCVVPLFDQLTFIGFDAQMFDFAPPDGCPGPWQKVVLSADFDVTAGRQFDRTAKIWIGGANVYFGTTQEPRATVAPSWHIERDLTDYSALFASAQNGRVDLGNVVDDTYTGVIHGSASLAFYPLVATAPDHPPRPDVVLPLAADATGRHRRSRKSRRSSRGLLRAADQHPARFPRRHRASSEQRRVLVSVRSGRFRQRARIVSRHGFSRGRSHRRRHPRRHRADLSLDLHRRHRSGSVAALARHPDAFVRAVSRRSHALRGLAQRRPARIRSQSASSMHSRISRRRRISSFISITARARSPAISRPIRSTIRIVAITSDLTNGDISLAGTLDVTTTRDYEISGSVDTSDGRVTTDLTQHIAFSNAQIFDIVGSATYRQRLQQSTEIDTTTTVNTGVYSHVVERTRRLAARGRLCVRRRQRRLGRAGHFDRSGPAARHRCRR